MPERDHDSPGWIDPVGSPRRGSKFVLPHEDAPLPFWKLTDPDAPVDYEDAPPVARRSFVLVEYVDDGNGRPVLSGRGREIPPAAHRALAAYLGVFVVADMPARAVACALLSLVGCKFRPTQALLAIGYQRDCVGCREATAKALASVRAKESAARPLAVPGGSGGPPGIAPLAEKEHDTALAAVPAPGLRGGA